MFKLYWVSNDGNGVLFDLGEVLKKYGFVFIGRLRDEDAYEARRFGVVEESYYSLYIFKPHEYYYSMNIEDGFVSRRHALLEFGGDSLFIVDHGPEGKGSKNGTFINGKRIKPAKPYRLSRSDEVSLGSLTKLKVVYGNSLSIDTPTILGRSDLEALERAGVDVAVKYIEGMREPLVYVQQKLDKPITAPSGIVIASNPNPLNIMRNLLIHVQEAIIKLLSKEEDAVNSIKYVATYLRLARRDIAVLINQRKILDELDTVTYVLEGFTKGYMLDEKIARENLEKLKIALKTFIDKYSV